MRTSLLTLPVLLLMTATGAMAGVLRVGTWSSSGTSPHSTLTSALKAATAGDEVWVVQGLYQEAEFIIPSGVSVYGGFTGSETHLSERNYATYFTILDGSGAHRVATVSGLLDGFTLRNGRTGDNGGGVIVKSGGILSHCVAFANEAGYDGGGVYAEDGATVTNTLLTDNHAGNDGAALSGVPGYRAINLTAADNIFTDKPEIKKTLPVPVALTAGQVLSVAEPDILNPDEVDPHGSTILVKGWELDGHAIPMPYTVTYTDNGKKLRFWAANAVGVGVSNEVAVTVTWTVTSSVHLITPKAVCEGTTLAGAGIGNPVFSPPPVGGANYTYAIDGTPVSGLDYQLKYSDNGKLLTCEVKNTDGSIVGATTPAVRLAVMKAPDVLLSTVPALSIEEGQPLCLPTPVVISNGSDLTHQGWKWSIGGGAENTFNSCDKATTAMNGATIYYTAENGCSAGVPSSREYTTLTVTNPVGEFLQIVPALCAGMPLNAGISFNDGGNTGDYYIGNTYIGKAGEEGNFATSWDDVKATALAYAHNLQVLRFSYNGGKNERRITLTVHPVPVITVAPVTPAYALCLGDAHTLTIEATGDNLSYQWERSVNSTDGEDGDWSGVPGFTTAACRLTADVTAYYRCAVTGVCIDKSAGVAGGKITSPTAKLTVNDPPVIPDVDFTAADLTICAGSEISTILADKTPTLAGTPATDQGWTLGGIKIAADYQVLPTDNGKVLGYWASNACGTTAITFADRKLTVDEKPQVMQDPVDVSAVEDSRVRLSVSASGSSLTYTWQKKMHSEGEDKWTAIDPTSEPSAATPAYSFTAANITTATFNGADVLTDYRCVVGTANACKATTATSAPATVTVTRSKAAVALRRQPASFEVCNSATAPYGPGFTVEVEGSGHFVYSWYNINDKITPVEQTPASGLTADAVAAKTNTFKPSGAGTYYCMVTSTDDAVGVQTQAVTLTVSQAPVINSITPASAKICEGGSVTLGVDAVGSVLSYQWYQQLDATQTPATDTKKGTAPTFTPVGLASTSIFYCIVGSGSVCTQTIASASVVVTVQEAPKITTQPASQSVCGGAGIRLEVEAVNADRYQWYYNGATTGSNSATLANVKDGGVYTCVVSKTGGVCGESTSVPALITVADKPKVNLGTRTSLTACAGDLITLPSPEVETGGSVIVPEKTGWYLSTEANPATATLVASFLMGNADVTYHYKLTYKCSAGGSETVLTIVDGLPTLTVNSLAITTQPLSQTYCEGIADQTLTIATSITTGVTYQWYKDGAALTSATDKTNGSQSASFKLGSATSDVGVYTCEVKLGTLTVVSSPAIVTVNAKPSVVSNSRDVTVCQGSPVTLQVEAKGHDLQYIWDQGITSTSSAVAVSPEATTTYTCTVKNSCDNAGKTSAITVTVNTPVAITTQPKDEVKCAADGFTNLSVTVTGTSPSYQWYKDNAVQIGATGSSYAAGQNEGVYHCVVSNACGTATSAPATLTRHAALAAMAYTDKPALCGSEATIVGIKVTAGAAVAYQWDKAGTVINGATSSTMAVVGEDGTAGVSRAYNCTVTDVCGKMVKPSVGVTHNPVPKITAQPVGGDVCNATKVLGVNATGAKGSGGYAWYKDGVAISGAATASYTVPNAVGSHSYYCMVTSDQCGSVASTSVQVSIEQAPAFALSAALSTTYAGLTGEPMVLSAIPDYTANGSTVTGGRWVYGSSKTVLGSTWQPAYNNQALYYQISYKGICSAGGTTLNSPQQGTLKWANFWSNDVPSGLIAGKFYTMMDTRDRKIYRIKKMADGQIWMVQNLDYGICTAPFDIINSRTNAKGITGHDGELLYGVCVGSADFKNAKPDNGCSYKFYNWQAAMQDERATIGRSDFYNEWYRNWKGICPSGWHLPNHEQAQNMMGGTARMSGLIGSEDYSTADFAGVISGWYSPENEKLSQVDMYGYVWTSALEHTTSTRVIPLYYPGEYWERVPGLHIITKSNGAAVRCVKN